jgi:phosphatidylinositol alpha 1,6-mannosyltransferase
MKGVPRVALFTDAYSEANGVARVSRDLEAYAARCGFPFLCVYAGGATRVTQHGLGRRLELRRSGAAFRIEHDLRFDLLLWRHLRTVTRVLGTFRPDIVHITGPSDVGQLGAYLGHRLSIPMVGSWHTNLHEYAALRLGPRLAWLPSSLRLRAQQLIERRAFSLTALFYQIPRVLLAPNESLAQSLRTRTGRPTSLMKHGVDTRLFTPAKRDRHDGALQIGFVGRLSAEKNVRLLVGLERALRSRTDAAFQFVIVGEGSERAWLERRMTAATFAGVLEGEALARAYANMDLFVFPSESETFGLALLEAMASGVPVVAMARGGPTTFVEHRVSGLLAADNATFVEAAVEVATDRSLRCRLGRSARTRALDWSWDAAFDSLYDVYAETAEERS